jgi:hypothetical protein
MRNVLDGRLYLATGKSPTLDLFITSLTVFSALKIIYYMKQDDEIAVDNNGWLHVDHSCKS